MASLRTAFVIDIGGTAIKTGIIREDGTLLVTRRIPTPSMASPEYIAQQIITLIYRLCDEQNIQPSSLAGVGVSIAAFITHHGVVTATAHLSQEWVGYDLAKRLLRDLIVEYYFALDTPAPTLGEAYYGAGHNIDNFVYVTVSTGIGAGIIADGRYFIGGLGWAGGLGHTIVDEKSPRVCKGCGNHGCLETFAATQGIIATADDLLPSYPDSTLQHQEITPRLLAEHAHAGDALAKEIWQRVGHALGIGLTNIVNIVSPTRIVIGGGIAQAGELLFAPARRVIQERAFPPIHRETQVVQSQLGDLSGIYGCAAMVFHDLRINPVMETMA